MKQTIIRKLTSRKLWAAIVGFITPLMLAFGYSQAQTSQVTAIIMAGGTLIAYIVGEGMTDAAGVSAKSASGGHTVMTTGEAQK